MSTLTPCPSCNRHVRVGDAACPFCGAAISAAAPAAANGAGLRGRLGRAALFAAGATLLGLSACTDSKCDHLTCTGAAGVSGGGTGGTTGVGGTTGSGGAAGNNDAGTDAVSPTDGPVAIYSAVFPPPIPSPR